MCYGVVPEVRQQRGGCCGRSCCSERGRRRERSVGTKDYLDQNSFNSDPTMVNSDTHNILSLRIR